MKHFAKLREDNKSNNYSKKSSKTCTGEAHPTPLSIDDCPGKFIHSWVFIYSCMCIINSSCIISSTKHIYSELKDLLDIPKDLYSNPKEYPRECILVFNLCVEHYKRIKDIKSIHKQQLIHTLVRIPWDRLIDSKDPVVLALLNYCTLETGSRLGPRDHPATKKRPDKDELSARTWNWLRDMVGEEIYNKMFHADADPIDYPKDTKLSDLVSPEDYKRIIDSWSKVLNGMNEIFDHIALCSKETQEKWGKRVHGGADGLEKDFHDNPGKYISANPYELNVLFHPSSLYEKLKWSMMQVKMPTCDAFGTDLIQKFPGHENEVCTHNMSIFNKNSEAYAQAQAAYEEGSALGREVCKMIRELKSAIDEGISSLYDDDDESPTAEEFYTVENLDQVKPFLLEDKEVDKLSTSGRYESTMEMRML